MRRNRSVVATLAFLASTVLVLAACSEPGQNDGSTATDAKTTIDNSLAQQFAGGTVGQKASGDPFVVGVINQEGGAVSDPEVSVAIKAAFDYINDNLGGVRERPLQMKLCKIGSSEEEAQQCAQQMLNDSRVDVIIQGGLNVGTQAVHETINGAKPVFVTLANPGSDTTAANTFAFNASAVSSIPTVLAQLQAADAKTIGVIADSNPGNQQIAGLVKESFEAVGLKVQLTSFPEGTTDLTPVLTSALAQSPDFITPSAVTTSACIAYAKAMQTITTSVPLIASGLCATDQLRDALGDFPKWYFQSTSMLLYPKDDTGQVDLYKAIMAKYAGSDAELAIGAPAAFGAAFAVVKALNGIEGDLTVNSISAAANAFPGPVLLGTPKLKFGSVKDMPALGGMAGIVYQYKGNGDWTKSDWYGLPD